MLGCRRDPPPRPAPTRGGGGANGPFVGRAERVCLGLPAGAISFQSANACDAHGASDFGMRVVWCNRYGQRRERLPGAPDFEIRTLAELPALLA